MEPRSPRFNVEDLYDTTMDPQKLLDAFNHLTPLSNINPTLPTHEQWAALISHLSKPSPVIRSATIRYIDSLVNSLGQVPEILFGDLGSLLVAKAIIDFSQIKEKEAEKVRKYRTMYTTMNKYAVTLVSDILILIKKIPPVWARAVVEAAEAADSRDTVYCDVFNRLIVQIAVSCPKAFGPLGTDALKVVFSKQTQWVTSIMMDTLLFTLNSPLHKKYLGSDQVLASLISPMSSPEHWIFPLRLVGRTNPDRQLKELQYSTAVKCFFETIKTWPGLLSLTSMNGIECLVVALHSPVPKQIDMLINNLYSLFQIKQPLFSSRFEYPDSGQDLLSNQPIMLAFYTHLLHVLIESNFFDALCDVCVMRQMHDDFSREAVPLFPDNKLDKPITQKLHRATMSEHTRSPITEKDDEDDKEKKIPSEDINALTVVSKSVYLLGELLHLAGVLFPTKNVSLQKLFATACDSVSNLQTSSVSLLVNLHTHIQHKIESNLLEQKKNDGMSINDYFYSDTTNEINQAIKGLSVMDESEIKRTIQSLNSSANESWNWIQVSTVLTSVLQNMRYFPIIEKTPFLKALVKFYQPSKKKFTETDFQKTDTKISLCGLMLFHILIQTESGKILLNPILKEIESELNFFIQMATKKRDDTFNFTEFVEKNHFFDQGHLMKKMSREYFGFIGSLSDVRDTLDGIFVSYRTILTNKSLNQLSDLISSSFKISISSHRSKLSIVETMLGSENVTVINRAIKEIGRTILPPFDAQPNFQSFFQTWAIPTLLEVMQKPGQNVSIIKQIIQILSTALNNEKTMELFIQYISKNTEETKNKTDEKNPLETSIKTVGLNFSVLCENNGRSLLYKILTNNEIIKKCMETTDYIDKEYQFWIEKECKNFVENIETKPCLPHFFEILGTTVTGCAVLQKNNTKDALCEMLNTGDSNDKAAANVALAVIAASQFGFNLIDKEITDKMFTARFAEPLTERVLSLWSLSILCKNKVFKVRIEKEGWNVTDKGVVIPQGGLEDPFYKQNTPKVMIDYIPFNPESMTQEQADAVKCVRKMRHATMWRNAIKELNKKRAENVEVFKDLQFGISTCQLINCIKLNILQRSTVYETFLGNIPIDKIKEQIAKDSDKIIEVNRTEPQLSVKRSKRATMSQQCVVINP
ncbi:hypothetical protein EIN_408890 [Entamoeba invadens IP1]|uniref:Uncharacterized protein n=1 Tax=Entamoeba invadens IP1 TaxID=370355 RepID=A0A0A1TZK4_ENTIV|nr:hypothetical protein EIN_408890 [Entamoeba invadens IP1]ELP85610.1 hypothetical protein EIN_408890 [Entamoeba invadens IP1]|eukprot:XP_004184956.1 hypothetical protein EIN_408890 [Entamoeba invadens IP1]